MKLHIGASAAHSKKITDNDIQAFAELTGDRNPLHLDDAYAKKTRFKRRIAHGMLSASLHFSRAWTRTCIRGSNLSEPNRALHRAGLSR